MLSTLRFPPKFLGSNAVRGLGNLNFLDTKYLELKSKDDLIRTSRVYLVCKIKPLVVFAEELSRLSYFILRTERTNKIVRPFYDVFCAGEGLRGMQRE